MVRNITLWIMIVGIAALLFAPEHAYSANAQSADLTKFNPQSFKCPANPGEYVQALVKCVEDPIRRLALHPEGPLSITTSFMKQIIAATISLALIWFGVRVASNQNALVPRAFSIAIRAGLVVLVLNQAYPYANKLFVIFDELKNVALPAGFSIWVEIDKFMADILGFATGDTSLKDGLIGLLSGSLFSKNFGVMLSLVGAFTVLSLLAFCAHVLFIYLSSVMAISFMIIIAPFLLPLFVFTYSEHYLMKWFDIVLANIITVMLMFTFLSIFLTTLPATGTEPEHKPLFAEITYEIKSILGPDYLKHHLYPNRAGWRSLLNKVEAEQARMATCPPDAVASCDPNVPNLPPQQSTNNPLNSRSMNVNAFRRGEIHFGDMDNETKREITYLLLQLFIFTVMMNVSIGIIPRMASDIANGATTGATNLVTPLGRAIRSIGRPG